MLLSSLSGLKLTICIDLNSSLIAVDRGELDPYKDDIDTRYDRLNLFTKTY